jgi:rhodanese-related sulfurtransferase
MDSIQENLNNKAEGIQENFQVAHEGEEGTIEKAKEAFQKNIADKFPVPTPKSGITPLQATAHELKSRLDWGEPGLTMLDVRDRAAFNDYHIQGAMNMPMATLVDAAQFGLNRKRDIYIYAGSDADAVDAVDMLRAIGYSRVAVLQGGMTAWEAIGGAVEGPATDKEPGPGAHNIFSRLKEFSEERARERQMK